MVDLKWSSASATLPRTASRRKACRAAIAYLVACSPERLLLALAIGTLIAAGCTQTPTRSADPTPPDQGTATSPLPADIRDTGETSVEDMHCRELFLSLSFAPGIWRLTDSLAEEIILSFERDFSTEAMAGVIRRRAHLELLAVVSPDLEGPKAPSIAKRRASTVRRFLTDHWSVFRTAYRNSPQSIRIHTPSPDSAQKFTGTGLPATVDIVYVQD